MEAGQIAIVVGLVLNLVAVVAGVIRVLWRLAQLDFQMQLLWEWWRSGAAATVRGGRRRTDALPEWAPGTQRSKAHNGES